MTRQTITRLVFARYRLQWAKVRGSALHSSLFLAAQGLLLLLVLITASSGLAGAAVAVRLGRAEFVARTILGAVFLNALVASVLLGLGMSQAFSDAVLRRYPLSRAERFVTRQLLALFEPLWLFTVAVYLGAAVGFWAMGAAPLWRTLPAALLLVAANYLLARLLVTIIDRWMAIPAGQVILFALFNLLALSPTIVRSLDRTSEMREHLALMFTATPPFSAAAMMGGGGVAWHLALLAGWIVLLGGALVLVESRPASSQSREGAVETSNGLCDRVASRLPVLHPALVSKTLRHFLRNPRVRMNLPVGIVVGAFLLRPGGPADATAGVIGPLLMTAFIGSLSTLEFDINLFGYESSGVRRLLLAPASMAAVLRAVSITSLLFGLAYSLLAILVWSVLFPVFADARILTLTVCSALSGSFVLRGVGLWTTVLLPRRADYGVVFRTQGGAGIYVVMATIFAFWLAIRSAAPGVESGTIIRYWRTAPIVALLCMGLYFVCLYGAGRPLTAQRERVLSVIERRS